MKFWLIVFLCFLTMTCAKTPRSAVEDVTVQVWPEYQKFVLLRPDTIISMNAHEEILIKVISKEDDWRGYSLSPVEIRRVKDTVFLSVYKVVSGKIPITTDYVPSIIYKDGILTDFKKGEILNFFIGSKFIGKIEIKKNNFNKPFPIEQAVIMGNYDLVKKLINQDPKTINSRDSFNSTPLHWACWQNYFNIVKLLVENGADIQAVSGNTGMKPIHDATRAGSLKITKFLIGHGALINEKCSHYNRTPLEYAKISKNEKLITYLKQISQN